MIVLVLARSGGLSTNAKENGNHYISEGLGFRVRGLSKYTYNPYKLQNTSSFPHA